MRAHAAFGIIDLGTRTVRLLYQHLVRDSKNKILSRLAQIQKWGAITADKASHHPQGGTVWSAGL